MAFDGDDLSQKGGVSRRTVVKAAAWTAPAIVLATAAPAAAASNPANATSASGIKPILPLLGKTTNFTVNFHNGSGSAQPVSIISVKTVGVPGEAWSAPTAVSRTSLPTGNRSLTFKATYSAIHVGSFKVTITYSIAGVVGAIPATVTVLV